MRRVINFRAALFAALGLVLGIYSFYQYLFGVYWVAIVFVSALAVGWTVFIVLKNKAWKGFLVAIVAFVLGVGVCALSYHAINRDEALQRHVVLTGRVCDLSRNGTDSSVVYLEDCVSDDGHKYRGRVKTYVFDREVQTGDVFTVSGILNSSYPVNNVNSMYKLRIREYYELEIENVISQREGKLKVDEKIRMYIYNSSHNYMDNNGDVMYALLTGDRDAMSSEKETVFKETGIVHLLAVSGLHVGFIVTVLSFVLKKFKLHPLIEGSILLVVLVFYAYVCNFTPSVVRAVIMVACAYLARAFYGRYDLLSSLSWAVTVILLICPFYLFDLGFQLSALSVYGIATLYSAVNRAMSKRKIHVALRYPLNSLLLSSSCSAATFFTVGINYGAVPLLGVFINLMAIPFVSVAFMLGIIGLLPSVFHYVLWLPDKILYAVCYCAESASKLAYHSVQVSALNVTVVAVAVWLFACGGYVYARRKGKIIIHSVCMCLVALFVGLSFVKLPCKTQAYVSYGYNDTVCVAVSPVGDMVICGNFSDNYALSNAISYASKYKVKSCALYVTEYENCSVELLKNVTDVLPVTAVYKLNFGDNFSATEHFASLGIQVRQQLKNTSTGNDVIVSSVYNGELRAVKVQTGDVNFAVVFGDVYVCGDYLKFDDSSDYYVLRDANETYSKLNLTTLSMYQSSYAYNYGANKYGNFTITQKGDKIKLSFGGAPGW